MCVFLHVPKTGGTWVREALRAGGVAVEPVDPDEPHTELDACPCPQKFKIAFVRHPLSVYQSYWRFKKTDGWDRRNPFDGACASGSFASFVENVLAKYPGWCSRRFESFVGVAGAEIEFVGRCERLADDLVRALRAAGEPFDEARLRETPPVNVSVWPIEDARWPDNLAERVLTSESDALERFGYDRRVPGRISDSRSSTERASLYK
jgi:hypothetical protein